MIEPRTLKGFRDHLPAQALARERILDVARRVYRSYGFAPIDTPALEYLEILTGKGSAETDKQLYRFTDHGGREVGMRFDLTVPFARFCAQHIASLGTPFKRYHMATVWRGENTQRGRYREFMQCDFDTIGTTSPVADLETVLVVHDLLAAIGIERTRFRGKAFLRALSLGSLAMMLLGLGTFLAAASARACPFCRNALARPSIRPNQPRPRPSSPPSLRRLSRFWPPFLWNEPRPSPSPSPGTPSAP
jgi:hypothetical protein